MAEYAWPSKADSQVIGKPHSKVDALAKSTGAAKYAYDINPPNMLLARALGCPHAHCKIKSIDFADAKKVPGVILVKEATGKKVGSEIEYQGDLIAYVVGESEGAIAEGLKAIKVEYDLLDVFVDDENLEAAEKAGRTAAGGGRMGLGRAPGAGGDNAALKAAFDECAVQFDGYYGVRPITHMCLEPHGSTAEWNGNELTSHISSQNISGAPGQLATPLGISAANVIGHCDYVGGGFGSKFSADYWCADAAKMAKEIGRPVKLMLDRDLEVKIAGARPSGYAKIKVGADKTGLVKAWDSNQWSTPGVARGGSLGTDVVPYIFRPANINQQATSIRTNAGAQRAWRAPSHPQGCAISHAALDDVAAKLGIDAYDVVLANLPRQRREVYTEEMKIAAKHMDWKAKWHPHGKGEKKGSVVSGMGMAFHTWAGGGQSGQITIKIDPSGSVEAKMSVQDLGTGTRTVIAMVIAESLGLKVEDVTVNIGNSKYPRGPSSGGSVTVASVSSTARYAGVDAIDKLKESVAAKLGVDAASLVAKDGKITSKTDATKSMTWKEACATLGMNPLETNGSYNRSLTGSQVGGVQMAEVEVDLETGVVRMKKFVAVQDCGLIINPKTAISQINGAMIMGVATALFEERIMDNKTGAFLNCEAADYKLARLGDIGQFIVELYEPESERARGVIGLGEPPMVSPMAAISNAVCNATGVRVPIIPMTPKRVLEALKAAAANKA